MAFDNTPNSLEAAFVQRDSTNQYYEQINISGSNLIVYLDASGSLTADNIGVWAGKYGIGTSTSSSYALTASYSLNGGSGGGTFVTGGTYPITASWAQTASYFSQSAPIYYDSDNNKYYSITIQGITGSEYLKIVPVTASAAVGVFQNISASYCLTASYFSGSISNAISTSYALTASYVTTSNVVGIISSASFSTTASYALIAGTGQSTLFATQSLFSTQSIYASQSINAYSASWVSASVHIINADTASYFITSSVTSASYVSTASYVASASFYPSSVPSSSTALSMSVNANDQTGTTYYLMMATASSGQTAVFLDTSDIIFNQTLSQLWLTSLSASNITTSKISGSFIGNVYGTASMAVSASWAPLVPSVSASYAYTSSFLNNTQNFITKPLSIAYAVALG